MFIQDYEKIKNEIINTMQVTRSEDFNPSKSCRERINYLKDFLKETKLNGFVLGISGGVDSTLAGKLCAIACKELREEGLDKKFYAVRLPSGVQLDELDAQEALNFIMPDEIITVNIGNSVDVLNQACLKEMFNINSSFTNSQIDFQKGNLKSRLRMAVQYYFSGMYRLAVIGTDHASEKTMGFASKWGDNACDLIVLNKLNKRQVRLCAKELGAPEFLYDKKATADLEELRPLLSDEDVFGFSYDDLDDFLEGKSIRKEVEIKIIETFISNRHKFSPIVEF